jgi:RNA polymerase sigma-70 factor (ECF subfamily)
VKKDDERTIRLLINGDEQAFDNIYREYYRGLCAFASQYVERTECEEIVQEVMLWLWENRSVLLPEIPVKHLLFTIVKNKCLNSVTHIRMREQVYRKLCTKFEEQFEDPDFYIENEITATLEKAIDALPADYRTAFTLNRFEDLTYNEIAERMNVSSKTVAYRISQALKLLRHALKEYMPLLFFL